jgi:putative RNA 2'-phosphotransferase
MDRNSVTISKFLAKHLRHAPDALGLTLQPGGWVSVDDLLTARERTGFTISYDELIECVETNDKKRFSFDDTGALIRANQGHSVEVDLQLEERQPPDVLYHGTVERFLTSILTEGLKKGKRHHVDHFSPAQEKVPAWRFPRHPWRSSLAVGSALAVIRRFRTDEPAGTSWRVLQVRHVMPVFDQCQVLLDFEFDKSQSGLKLFLAPQLETCLLVLGGNVLKSD